MPDLEYIESLLTDTRRKVIALQEELVDNPGQYSEGDRKAADAIWSLSKSVEALSDYLRENQSRS